MTPAATTTATAAVPAAVASAILPWTKKLLLHFLAIPPEVGAARVCFVACLSNIVLAIISICFGGEQEEKFLRRMVTAINCFATLKILFGPAWASFSLMMHSIGVCVGILSYCNNERDKVRVLPRAALQYTFFMGAMASLGTIGVFPTLVYK